MTVVFSYNALNYSSQYDILKTEFVVIYFDYLHTCFVNTIHYRAWNDGISETKFWRILIL
jgi:hypothetical protein